MRKWKPSPSRLRERCNSICATPGCSSWSGAAGGVERRPSRSRSRLPELPHEDRPAAIAAVALRPTRRRSSAPDPGARRRPTHACLRGAFRGGGSGARGPQRCRAERAHGVGISMRCVRNTSVGEPVRESRSAAADPLFTPYPVPETVLRRTRRESPIFALLRPSIRSRRPRMQFRRRIFHLSFRAGNGRRDLST